MKKENKKNAKIFYNESLKNGNLDEQIEFFQLKKLDKMLDLKFCFNNKLNFSKILFEIEFLDELLKLLKSK